MPTAGEVTGNHGDNGLLKATAEVIALENERRTALGCTQIGIGKKNQYDVTAAICQRGDCDAAGGGGQRSAVRGKKAHARPFKDRFLKYNENIFFDGLRWYDFHRGCAS